MQARNMSSRIWLVRLDCPSVWGWLEVLNIKRFPKFSWRLSQKCDQNLVSIFDKMLAKTSCRRTISLICLSARIFVIWPTLNGKKWANFVRRSMITHTAMTKSIVMCSYFYAGVGNGCRSLTVRWCSIFICWQTKHLATYSLFIAFHQKFWFKSWYILVLLDEWSCELLSRLSVKLSLVVHKFCNQNKVHHLNTDISP